MRLMMHVSMPVEKFNQAVLDGTAGSKIGRILEESKPEAAYFCAKDGRRSGFLIVNLDNGSRIESYVIPGERGSGEICLNGGAAKYGKRGDRVIIMSFCVFNEDEAKTHMPKVVRVDEKNKIVELTNKAGNQPKR